MLDAIKIIAILPFLIGFSIAIMMFSYFLVPLFVVGIIFSIIYFGHKEL